jgi:hypothetical protein
MPYTHSAVGIDKVAGYSSILEAKLCVTVTAVQTWYNNPDMDFRQYRLRSVYQKFDKGIVSELYLRFAGNEYGFAQVLFFVYRWIGETFKINMRNKKNWFPNGTICSELLWDRIELLGKVMKDQRILDVIHQWNKDNFHSGDVYIAVTMLYDYFELVEERWT